MEVVTIGHAPWSLQTRTMLLRSALNSPFLDPIMVAFDPSMRIPAKLLIKASLTVGSLYMIKESKSCQRSRQPLPPFP